MYPSVIRYLMVQCFTHNPRVLWAANRVQLRNVFEEYYNGEAGSNAFGLASRLNTTVYTLQCVTCGGRCGGTLGQSGVRVGSLRVHCARLNWQTSSLSVAIVSTTRLIVVFIGREI